MNGSRYRFGTRNRSTLAPRGEYDGSTFAAAEMQTVATIIAAMRLKVYSQQILIS